MPALTITAVDNTTDTITSVAHGLTTGDGPAAVYVPAGGVIPGGLAPNVDYYAIRVDNDHLKLADTNAHALSNTPINITSNGTLPLQLVISLPYRVPRIAAPGSQVKSDDFNKTWSSLVALWNLLTGQTQSIFNNGVTLATVAEAVTAPLATFRDWKGNIRTKVDHLGLRGGQVSEIEEHWRGSALSSDWTFSAGGGTGTAVPTDPSISFSQRNLLFTSGTGTTVAPTLQSQNLNWVDNDAVVVLEAMIRTPATLETGGNSDSIDFGPTFSAGRFGFFYSNASANWRCRWAGATVNNDSAVAVVASTNYRLRIELVGSNNSSAAAGTMTARYFINGVLVSTITVASWTADKAKLFFGATTLNTESYIWTLGRIRYQFTHILVGDNV